MENQPALELGPLPQIAHVLVDTDLPHLDHVLDYVVPDTLTEQARPGCLVRVTLAGKLHDGWIVSVDTHTDHHGRLSPLKSVNSALPIMTESTWKLARYLAKRHAATTSQVLSLAIPKRHVAAEKEALARPESDTFAGEWDPHAWDCYSGGAAYLQRLAQGESPRVVFTALPGHVINHLASVIAAVRASQRDVLVIVPTAFQANQLTNSLARLLGLMPTCVTSEDTASKRFGDHIAAVRGLIHVVVGTRTAQWLPVPRLGLVIVWDDGDDRLREQRAPRLDALDVAVARAFLEKAALLVGGWTRTVKAQALVHAGWAVSLVPERSVLRSATPRIAMHDHAHHDHEGSAGLTRLPPEVFRLVRERIEHGPVLIQVPRAGYVPVVSCATCHRGARCEFCGGPLGRESSGAIQCSWCGRPTLGWTCPHCGGARLRSVRVGSDRTGEELGRAFPGVPLAVSSSTYGITRDVDATPRLVVSTPGAEPHAHGGFAGGVLLDAQALAGRPELWAPQEAVRRWLNACAKVQAGAPVLLVGDVDPMLSQALVRWDPADLADRLLQEREALGFFPAATIVALDGPPADVDQVISACGGELMGIVPRGNPPDEQVRALVRASLKESSTLLEALSGIQQVRSSKRLPLVKVTVNPPELF